MCKAIDCWSIGGREKEVSSRMSLLGESFAVAGKRGEAEDFEARRVSLNQQHVYPTAIVVL